MTMKTDRPGWGERICFGAAGIGVRLVPSVITGFMLIYLTNVAFLDVAACSAIIGVSKVFDGISDIVIGNIIDNT
ncbi:MAG: MFS transporter, partial [Mogibacterium sp.]|nr:MFS transporter [Mogibacterium sp.]